MSDLSPAMWLGFACLISGLITSALSGATSNETEYLKRKIGANLMFVIATIWFAAEYIVTHK